MRFKAAEAVGQRLSWPGQHSILRRNSPVRDGSRSMVPLPAAY